MFEFYNRFKESAETELIEKLKAEFVGGKVSNVIHAKYSGDRIRLTIKNGGKVKSIYFYYMEWDEDGNALFMIYENGLNKYGYQASYTDTIDKVINRVKTNLSLCA